MSGKLNSQIGSPWIFLTGTTDATKNIAIPTVGTFPLQVQLFTTDVSPVAITATQSTANAKFLVLSSNVWASQNLRVGDYIYLQGVIRKIITVWDSKLAIELDYAFPSAITAQNVYITQTVPYRHVKVEGAGAANTATVQGVVLKSGGFVEFNEPAGISPIFYNASGGDALKFIVSQ